MGKGGPKIQVTEFGMSIHYGICTGPCELKSLIIKEKPVLVDQTLTGTTSVAISELELFGGVKKEGGVAGTMHFLDGADTQVLPNQLAVKLGRADGADAPGYRGIASIWLTGEGYSRLEGFYWSANVPYLPGAWTGVRRRPIGLNPAISMAGCGADAEQPFWTFDLPFTFTFTLPSPIPNDEPTYEFLMSWEVNIRLRDPVTLVDASPLMSGNWSTNGVENDEIDTDTADGDTFTATFVPVGSLVTVTVSSTGPSGANRWHVRTDPTAAGDINNRFRISMLSGGDPIFSVGTDSVVTYVTDDNADIPPSEWQGNPVGGGANYDYGISGIKFHRAENDDLHIPEYPDANPAHIIYECLTNTDWGMGSPSTLIDTASFNEAAQTLYDEAFGLSMIWTRQAAIQDFIQEVLDHIQAVLFVDPATGLLTLDLIRGDYDPDDLMEITPDNGDVTNFSRKLWGEIVNEIVVTWTNPINEQDETVVAQDLASIVTQGGLVSDGRNYYGVRCAALAKLLAQRDLRSSGAPLASCEAEVDRSFWAARPAGVVKVTWPEHGLSAIVFRITNVDYGRPGDPTIKLSLVEDVFGLDIGEYVAPPSTGWEDPSAPPEPLEVERVITLPLYFAADAAGISDPTDATYPEVMAGILGTTSSADTFAYDVWAEEALPDGTLEWQSIGTNNILGYAELAGNLAAEATSTAVGFANVIGQTSPAQGGFVLIGDSDDDETEMEIALVTDPGAVDLDRGVLDTIPRAWPAGTHVWFVDGSTVFEDTTVRAAGEAPDYKLRTRTSQGLLALADAALVTYTLTERPWLPNRPADVQIDSILFNTILTPIDMSARVDPWVTVEWANRNRITEDGPVLAWTDATMAPETGQTTTITVLTADGLTELAVHDELLGTSFDVPDASFGLETIVLIRVSSSRTDADGTFESMQAHQLWVLVGVSDRATEEGDDRLTEEGDTRVTEG